ncbi:MAG: tRNA (guanosine(46)-N7)-methyltransferase TrmB, partial [Alphaproteobacteria bacterium]
LLGAESFVNGVASCLSHLQDAGLSNVRIHFGDARDLLEVLPPAAIDRAFLLYPDPWPKARHIKRRFVNPEGMDLLARTLKPGARFHLATDIADYAEHSIALMDRRRDFARLDHPVDAPWPGWIRTRYEAKAIREGRRPHYLIWTKR